MVESGTSKNPQNHQSPSSHNTERSKRPTRTCTKSNSISCSSTCLALGTNTPRAHTTQQSIARGGAPPRPRAVGWLGSQMLKFHFAHGSKLSIPSFPSLAHKHTVSRHTHSPQPTQRPATLCMQSEALYARRPRREDGIPARSPPHSRHHSHQHQPRLASASSSLRPLPTEPRIGGFITSTTSSSSSRRNSSSSGV